MLKNIQYYIAAPTIHEAGHIITAGGVNGAFPYIRYNPGFDPFTFTMSFASWNDTVRISGLLFSMVLLYKYHSPLFLLYLIILARWDLLSIYVHNFIIGG